MKQGAPDALGYSVLSAVIKVGAAIRISEKI